MSAGICSASLAGLGWTDFFGDQLEGHEAGLIPCRIATVHRARLTGISQAGPVDLALSAQSNTGDFAVGDWVLADPVSDLLVRRLDRKSVLERRTQGGRIPQLAAANVDTLFIVTSCNADFNPARLERYLAMRPRSAFSYAVTSCSSRQKAGPARYARQAAAV